MSTKITVSLTTTPKRIDRIKPTLRSLLSQTKKIDTILLNIPLYCARLDEHLEQIPQFLRNIESRTQLKIQITEDYGPATKFIPACKALEPDENHFLIWLDDDIFYSKALVETLTNNCPRKTAIATCGFILEENHHRIVNMHLGEADIIEGWGGICCRTSDIPNLDKILTLKPYKDMTFLEKCHWHSDDYVISRALQDNGIKTVVCNTQKHNRYRNRILNYGLSNDALQNSKITDGHHNAYWLLEKERQAKLNK